MRVKSCVASDGGGHVIKLSDEYGCVLRPKMISRFLKARSPDEKATVITYAFFHAFKFPDALSVHIKCKVEICRHGCLDHCQASGSNERNDVVDQDMLDPTAHESNQLGIEQVMQEDDSGSEEDVGSESSYYDDLIRNGEELTAMASLNGKNNLDALKHANANAPQLLPQQAPSPAPSHLSHPPNPPMAHQQPQTQQQLQQKEKAASKVPEVHEDSIDDVLPSDPPMHEMLRKSYLELKKTQDEKFPHGPRTLSKDRMGLPPVAGPRALNLGEEVRIARRNMFNASETYHSRRRRSVVVSDRKARSADVGVSGIYDVISEADLAFSPDGKQEAVTVFQGKIAEEVVYGICMPVPGFSILFILVTSAAVVSALVAGSLLYRYQLQKAAFEAQQHNVAAAAQGHINPNTFASWMTLRLFRMNQCQNNGSLTPK